MRRRKSFRRQRSFDPSFLVQKATHESPQAYTVKHQFNDFLISGQIKENIQSRGYTVPTPIQDQVIPLIIQGKDVVGVANTGTGKTAAFLIPLINKVFKDRSQKVLIVIPTRELAAQIAEEFRAFASKMNLFATLCIGGVNIGGQINGLRRNPQFVIGTPGRLKDLEKRRMVNLSSFTTIVLDEVDRMLDMGFIHDVKYLISGFPRERHSLFFSATTNAKVKEVMQDFLTNPVMVSVKSQDAAVNVSQQLIKLRGKPKIEVLHELLIQAGFDKVLVFGRTKWGVEKLSKELITRGFKATAIHGNKTQGQRQRSLNMFKNGEVKVLLATDVASRGLDIDDVTHVINFDLPETQDDYINRIGRTGRADRKGVALTLYET